jgi:hypothetical protein
MKKLTTTMQRPPQTPEEAAMLGAVLGGVNSCFMAFSLDCEVPVVVLGIESLTGTREWFVERIRDCNRMVAFVTFIRNGVLADITFCQGKEVVEAVAFMFDGDTKALRVP